MIGRDLEQVDELTEGAIELLGAVGVENMASLSESETAGLHEEITQANGHLALLKSDPQVAEVAGWIRAARKLTGVTQEEPSPSVKKEVVSISSLPVALAVKKQQVLKAKIAVGDVPVMTDFVEESDLLEKVEEENEGEVRAEKEEKMEEVIQTAKPPAGGATGGKKKERRKKKSVRKRRSNQVKPESSPEKEAGEMRAVGLHGIPSKKSEPLGKLEDLEEERKKRPTVEPLKRNAGFDIRKTASPKLNEGKKLHSRRYVRGVLHPQPGRVKLAAVISLMAFLLFPLCFVAGGLVLVKEFIPLEEPLWLMAFPLAFLVFGFLYLVVAKPLKCRICGQPILASKSCFRHVKAHRRPLVGYILPTSLHMLLFHWFRCIYCGTSVRLKE